ncbi:MAG: hypothetical protein IKJ52_05895 [Muribaculaceae bacterium]|nr:hypothetical protein [Muribaculaceae bacterium]
MKKRAKQFEDLIEEIGSQASKFACDKEIDDFEITVRITCEDGWCSANLISVNEYERSEHNNQRSEI